MKSSLQEYYSKLYGQLSVRAKNVLKSNKLNECYAFLEKTSKPNFSFMNLRNSGRKTAEELDSLLKKLTVFQTERTEEESNDISENEQIRVELRREINTPLIMYNLSARSLNCLNKVGILTLGDLVTSNRDTILKIPYLGKSSFREIENIVVSKGFHWGMDISMYGIVNDPEKRLIDSKLALLPGHSTLDKHYVLSFREKYGHFPMIFILYKLVFILTEYERKVLELSWGINNPFVLSDHNTLPDLSKWYEGAIQPKSLDEIATLFCMTRERIRQIYEKANKKLINCSLTKKLFHFDDWNTYGVDTSRPFLFLEDLSLDAINTEKEYFEDYIKEHSTEKWIYAFVVIAPCYSINLYWFIISMKGLNPYWVDYDKKELFLRFNSNCSITPLFLVGKALNEYNYSKAIKEVDRLQRAKKTEDLIIPINSYFIDDEFYWNKKSKPGIINRNKLMESLIIISQTLCNVATKENTFIFKANRIDYSNQLYEILKKAGERLHRSELYKRLKHLCHERGFFGFNYTEPAQITPFLTSNPQIIPYGKSGFWGLKEWGELAGSIRDISMSLMRKSKVPLQIEELAKEVLKHRPDSEMDHVTTIIRQSVYMGELLLFFDDYVGLPNKKYDDRFIIYPRNFIEWMAVFRDFVIKNKRFPFSGQLGYEGHLYRWHHKASQLTELSSDEILLFDVIEKELAHFPHNATENNFLHNCELYKKFVEGNNRMLEESDDREIYRWFYSASREYSTYNDNRNKYFSQLLQFLSNKLY